MAFKFSSSPTVVSGQVNLSAPTGVKATDGVYSTKVGLIWDTMRGATLYRIFRNTTDDPLTATAIGTTQANTFFDATATQGQTFSTGFGLKTPARQVISVNPIKAHAQTACLAAEFNRCNRPMRRRETRLPRRRLISAKLFSGTNSFLRQNGRLRNLSFRHGRRN